MIQKEMKDKLVEVTEIKKENEEKPVEEKKILTHEERKIESIKSVFEKNYPDKETRYKALELMMDELTVSGEGETYKAYKEVFESLKKELNK